MNFIKYLIMSIIAVFAPIKAIIFTTGFLVIMDMITGMLAARKRKEKITSAAMRRSLSKMVIYQIAVLSGFLVEIFMIDGLVPVSKIVAGVIGSVEFFSVIENIQIVYGKPIFKDLLEKLGSKNDVLNVEELKNVTKKSKK